MRAQILELLQARGGTCTLSQLQNDYVARYGRPFQPLPVFDGCGYTGVKQLFVQEMAGAVRTQDLGTFKQAKAGTLRWQQVDGEQGPKLQLA